MKHLLVFFSFVPQQLADTSSSGRGRPIKKARDRGYDQAALFPRVFFPDVSFSIARTVLHAYANRSQRTRGLTGAVAATRMRALWCMRLPSNVTDSLLRAALAIYERLHPGDAEQQWRPERPAILRKEFVYGAPRMAPPAPVPLDIWPAAGLDEVGDGLRTPPLHAELCNLLYAPNLAGGLVAADCTRAIFERDAHWQDLWPAGRRAEWNQMRHGYRSAHPELTEFANQKRDEIPPGVRHLVPPWWIDTLLVELNVAHAAIDRTGQLAAVPFQRLMRDVQSRVTHARVQREREFQARVLQGNDAADRVLPDDNRFRHIHANVEAYLAPYGINLKACGISGSQRVQYMRLPHSEQRECEVITELMQLGLTQAKAEQVARILVSDPGACLCRVWLVLSSEFLHRVCAISSPHRSHRASSLSVALTPRRARHAHHALVLLAAAAHGVSHGPRPPGAHGGPHWARAPPPHAARVAPATRSKQRHMRPRP